MRLLIFTALVAGALAVATDKPLSLSLDSLNEIIDDLKKHKDSIPSFVMDPITNLTVEEKTQIVDFVNNLKKEQVETINSLKQLVQLAEEQAPLVGKKFKAIYDEFLQRTSKVSKEGQDFINMLETKWLETVQSLRIGLREFLGNALQFLDDFQKEGKKLTSESWRSLEEQFPEQVKAWKIRFPSIWSEGTDEQTTSEKTV